MTRPTGQPDPEGDGFARAEAVAGLAREVDGIRRELATLAGVPTRVDDLARAVAQLADAVATAAKSPPRPAPAPAPSWLVAPADPQVTGRLLDDLAAWLHAVYLRYSDGAGSLPECWLYHPEVVEELVWLQHTWLAAYQGPGASAQAAGDWHDRQRPGVTARIKSYAGGCSRERHQTRPGWSTVPQGAMPVPGMEAAAVIAGWWANGRDHPAPEPAPRPAGPHMNGAGRP